MLYGTRLRLVLSESPETGIPGVKVALYDRDEYDPDDFLAQGVTDENGEIFFGFRSEQFTDLEDQPLWHTKSLPDLYVEVYDAQGRVVLSTREEVLVDRSQWCITVPLSRALVEEYHLR